MHDETELGLSHDLHLLTSRFRDRRSFLKLLGAASLTPLVGCATSNATGGDGGGGGDGGSCSAIPTETAGPYPGDGTNGANALSLSGIVRSDIRTSVGTASGTAGGVPLTVTLSLVDTACVPLVGYAVYLWHCDRDGAYSMYAGTAMQENYLRGVQESDDAGNVTFTTIFPGCYSGRWPHMHFEIYSSLDAATNGANKVRVSQLALPESACDAVYATTGYSASVSNFASISLASDNVFSDGASSQIPSVTGSAGAGYAATLTVPVPV